MRNYIFRSKFRLHFGAMGAMMVLALGILFLVDGSSQTVSAGPSQVGAELSHLGEIQASFTTTITINTTEDVTAEDQAENNENKHTCSFTQGAFFFPANGSSAGLCTLRRAILEASARPQSDRPILIQFDIPANDPNADLEEAGTWTIALDEALPLLKTDTIINLNGEVTIDGSTQPGIRNDGPGIILDTGDTSLEVFSTNNVIRDISWKGGGALLIQNKADNNLIENIWMGLSDDGQSIHFRDTGNYKRMAIGGLFLNSNGNIVRNSTISGAFAKAVDIGSNKQNNLVEKNNIGTLADGTVPLVDASIECLSSFSFDPSNHYGGWGIALSGSNNTVQMNRIAGLHILKGENDTSPPAIEIFGADNIISNNVIGVDSKDVNVGVCGHGIKFSGSGHEINDNEIVRSRISFEDSDETGILASDTSPLFGQNTVRRNTVLMGPGDILTFANGIKDSLRFFKPARITNISNAGILTGQSEDGYDCPNCIIDLYLDDTDEIQDVFAYIGSVVADGDGKFTFDMGQPLPAGRGIRTMATTQNAGVIGNFGAGTSSEASQLYTPITDITFTGPITGFTGVPYQINFLVDPVAVTLPITYTITATDDATSETQVLDSRSSSLVRIWTTPGIKTIEVKADNGLSTRTESYQIEIEQADIEGDITDIVFSGPSAGEIGVEYTFDITVEPADVKTPINYTLEVTDVPNPFGDDLGRFVEYKKAWSASGTKTIKVTADNGINSLTKSFEIVIAEPPATPEPSTTPGSTITPEPSTTPGSTPGVPATPVPSSTPGSPSSFDEFIYLPVVVR